MLRSRVVFVLALAVVCTGAAAAKGLQSALTVRPEGARGPLVRYDLEHASKRFSLPPGMLSADGSRFAYVRGGRLTISSVPTRRVLARIPAPLRSSVEAISPSGRYLVLRTGSLARLIDGGRTVHSLALPTGFTVDALSPDGHWLYLIEHKAGQDYAVRRYNIRTGVLLDRPLVQKGEQEQMAGTSAGVIQTLNGTWQYTLYVNAEHRMAFVHALNLVQSYTVCIDLPGTGTPAQLRTYSLALSPDLGHLYAANPALGVIADVPPSAIDKPTVRRFPAASAAATAAASVSLNGRMLAFTAGSRLWLYDAPAGVVRGPYDAGGDVVGLGFANARRLYAAHPSGPLTPFDAATGKRD